MEISHSCFCSSSGSSLSRFPCKLVLSSSPSDQLRIRSFIRSLVTRRRRGRRNGRFGRAPNPTVVSYRSKVVCGLLPSDPWSPSVDSQSIASQLFAISLFPYLGFLYYITRSKTAPKLTLFGFYFLLAFVGATRTNLFALLFSLAGFFSINPVPAGIYAKLKYGTSLANVDWLHGGAESLLTLTNLFIVLGLRRALRKINNSKKDTTAKSLSDITENQKQSSGL